MFEPETSSGDLYTITLDDDPSVHKQISKMLKMNSLPYRYADKLLENAHRFHPVAAFIDINLGKEGSGLDIIPQLRAIWSEAPIIVITSNPVAESIGDALAAGADDFIKKPFSQEELKARFDARRRQLLSLGAAEVLNIGDLTLNMVHKKLQGPKKHSFLSPIETKILKTLFESSKMVLKREEIKRMCWGEITVSDQVLDRHISSLRSQLKDVTEIVKIKTEYGKGYALEISVAEKKAS